MGSHKAIIKCTKFAVILIHILRNQIEFPIKAKTFLENSDKVGDL